EVRAQLRRLTCPTHGVRVEAVPFARHGSGFTADFEALVAWLAKTDKTTITRLVRIDWETVGRICARVVAEELDPSRLDGLFEIGVDEVSWRKRHNYLTLVTDHRTRKVVWGAKGKDAKALDGSFDELGAERSAQLRAVSMDMGPAFAKSVRAEGHAPQAVICFRGAALRGRRSRPGHRQAVQRRSLGAAQESIAFTTWNGSAWAPVRSAGPLAEDATAFSWYRATWPRRCAGSSARCRRRPVGRSSPATSTPTEAIELIDRWCSRAQRSRLAPFVKAATTVRKHRDGILAAIRYGLSNGLVEGLNNKVRLIIRRAYGFHSADAALAVVMLSCGPIELRLPHERAA
ncbi:MAG: ISL3 family transposase, partial [Acidimicrobiales bacterium]